MKTPNRIRSSGIILAFVVSAAAALCAFAAEPGSQAGSRAQGSRPVREEPFQKRPFHPLEEERWIGMAIAYGPHRDGQSPGGASPTRAELREDLLLMSKHWKMLRVYGAAGPAETILDVIREEGIDMSVMLGVWIDPEERLDDKGLVVEALPQAREANAREVETAIRLAGAYPEIVSAVSVGNETQIFWSAHRVPQELLVGYVREVRAGTSVPVTVADDFNFWNKPESKAVAREVDFIVMHAHPLWNGLQLEDALVWTKGVVAEVQSVHPDHLIVLGETGWATKRHTVGEQATLMKGQLGEDQQKSFYDAVNAWTEGERFPVFFFEAFDENWKGGEHPDEVEKHWGLYRADRTPKKAMAVER
jgi:exo-beta-1,3-glucanase (GH17 family)